MGNGNAKASKNSKLADEIDRIASNYILQQNFNDINKLSDKGECDKLVILTAKVIGKNLNALEQKEMVERISKGSEETEEKKGVVGTEPLKNDGVVGAEPLKKDGVVGAEPLKKDGPLKKAEPLDKDGEEPLEEDGAEPVEEEDKPKKKKAKPSEESLEEEEEEDEDEKPKKKKQKGGEDEIKETDQEAEPEAPSEAKPIAKPEAPPVGVVGAEPLAKPEAPPDAKPLVAPPDGVVGAEPLAEPLDASPDGVVGAEPLGDIPLCLIIAKFYVKIAHVFAAIMKTINPVIIAEDKNGKPQKYNLMNRENKPTDSQIKKIEHTNFCTNRLNSLIQDSDYNTHNPRNTLLNLKARFCNMNYDEKTKKSRKFYQEKDDTSGEPGIPELLKLYYDVYDPAVGDFTSMSEDMKYIYEQDVAVFYETFTGKPLPTDENGQTEIKRFGDIPLREYHKNEKCKPDGMFSQNFEGSLNDEPLFKKYAVHMKKMMNTMNTNQDKLLAILKQLFIFPKEKEKKKVEVKKEEKPKEEEEESKAPKTQGNLVIPNMQAPAANAVEANAPADKAVEAPAAMAPAAPAGEANAVVAPAIAAAANAVGQAVEAPAPVDKAVEAPAIAPAANAVEAPAIAPAIEAPAANAAPAVEAAENEKAPTAEVKVGGEANEMAPKEETPKEETPKEETPKEEAPKAKEEAPKAKEEAPKANEIGTKEETPKAKEEEPKANEIAPKEEPKEEETDVLINPNLTDELLQSLINTTRKLIVELYLTCEMDFLEGVTIFESIVAVQLAKTTGAQIKYLNDMTSEYLVEHTDV